MFTCLVLLALFASCQGRAVNISNTWVLPEEGFPVFYRYFRDRISWYEADAVCQFHHANLVTVDTTAQYDAVRAYLKELDISSAVWVGLIRSNPDGDFTWTDYRGLSSDGYWSSAPDARAAPLCAAADPAADYRWEARACGGPTVASFICELPVPQWALGNEGCMVKAIPALTVLYLPESAAVQLTADCGLAAVKRVQCTGNVKREDLLKELSCNDEELTSTTGLTTDGINIVSELSENGTDLEIPTDLTTEEEEVTTSRYSNVESKITSTPEIPAQSRNDKPRKQQIIINKLNKMYTQKNINLDLLHNNNLQSNDIPKLGNNNENFLTVEQAEKLEDEKNMHHKMLHDELARHGNLEMIFTQPSDHFVPPLVMAKSKLSDDMTVLSLAEKHAQQLAEQRLAKHSLLFQHEILTTTSKPTTTEETVTSQAVTTDLGLKSNSKIENIKSMKSKKYKAKYEDPKARNFKIDGKLQKLDKSFEKITGEFNSKKIENLNFDTTKSFVDRQEDNPLELTVILKEPNYTKIADTMYTGMLSDEATSENLTTTEIVSTESAFQTTQTIQKIATTPTDGANLKTSGIAIVSHSSSATSTEAATLPLEKLQTAAMQDIALNHEIIKITVVKDDETIGTAHTVFEVTTLMPTFKDTSNESEQKITTDFIPSENTDHHNGTVPESNETQSSHPLISVETVSTTKFITETTQTPASLNTKNGIVTSTELPVTTTTKIPTSAIPITYNFNSSTTELFTTSSENLTASNDKIELVNVTEILDGGVIKNASDPSAIDDFNSPLLSGANEPPHRPNRMRRPQQQSKHAKFNPFRILG